MRVNPDVKPRAARITASILTRALPYIQRFHGRHLVVKSGGHAMVDHAMQRAFAQDIALLRWVGVRPIVVHGGGPQIDRMLEALQIESQFIQGMRVTTSETMDVVEMVLGGQVNKALVSLIGAAGGRAVGLTGKDGDLFCARRISMHTDNGLVDIGQVGEITSVKPDLLATLTESGFIPVIAPVGSDGQGTTLNVNADLAAGAIAAALGAHKLMLLTNTRGVLDQQGRTLTDLTPQDVAQLIKAKVIKGGMLPKIDCAVQAVAAGVERVHIIDGRVPHSVLLELFTDRGIGTLIKSDTP